MRLTGKILTFMTILIMMVNAVGIAQVTHICKLAVAGIEKGCEKPDSGKHDCCKTNGTAAESVPLPGKDCCTDVIKYYHQTLPTTLQQSIKVPPLNFYISLFTASVPVISCVELSAFSPEVFFYKEGTGKSIIIDLQTLLI